ncbi:PHP domain-containing protein [Candidatus Heimdallarchaeota archaeon]|nr:MAG: PHP domain-containing protein [Candidatus Heimdallarchaeota archaeon]
MTRYDLHVHTHYSDGVDSPEEIIRHAEKIGLAGIAITDHDTFEGLHKAMEIETDLMIIPGIEVSTCDGHILAYGLTEGEIEMGLTPQETVDIIHRMGGIAVPAHPFDIIRLGIKKKIYQIDSDAIESINGCCTAPLWNKKARKAAIKMDLPMTAGSDGHCTEEIGIAWTEFLYEPHDWQDVISMILRKESIPKGKTHCVIASKIHRVIKGIRKRKERPVPRKFIWYPKRKEKSQEKQPEQEEQDY